jgi:hypothetical protein
MTAGCAKKSFYTHTIDGEYKQDTQCEEIRREIDYIQYEDSSSFYATSLATRDRLYEGLKRCQNRDKISSKEFNEIHNMIEFVNGLNREAEQIILEGKELHMR